MREWSQVGKGIDKPESRHSHVATTQRMLAFPRSHVAVNNQTEKCSDIPTNVCAYVFQRCLIRLASQATQVPLLRSLRHLHAI
jgi:hypothetical protein